MRAKRYAVGIDFGTESARAVLVSCDDGSELATEIYSYRHGVIDEQLPPPFEHVRLASGWALQDPEDYVRALQVAVPRLLSTTRVAPIDIIGIGIDFTSCTMLPTLGDGTPLCFLDDFRHEPHAWVKLWKHHAAQPQADRINEVAAERGEQWLKRYGGKYSSEWFFSKALQILEEAPEVYARADRLIEAADWIVWQLTGRETRNSCAAGYKALWSKREGFPSIDFFAALDPRFERVIDEKMLRLVAPIGERAGRLSDRASAWTGLLAGTAVAVANVDFHVSVPAATVTDPGTMVMNMGTSNGHLLLSNELKYVEGICGVVEGGIVPGLFGYEAGQSAVGDILAWFTENAVPLRYHESARGSASVHRALEVEATRLRPGESGLIALDWWNGNRSVLVNADLRGLLIGMTLTTTPAEIYRALIEATAFGTRIIVDTFEQAGMPVNRIVACGGLPDRNRLLMQIYADVVGCEFAVAASTQTPALGAAMFGAVAAGADRGGYESIIAASRQMAHVQSESYRPNQQRRVVYGRLYEEYRRLHDLFGRGHENVMSTLKHLQSVEVNAAELRGDEAMRTG